MKFTLERAYKAKRKAPEADFQTRLVSILRERLLAAIVFHIPNGVNMPMPTAMKLRRMGLLSGIPDLCILYQGKSLFLECKADRGTVSPTQVAVFSEMRALGHRIEVVRTVAEALQYCGDAGIKINDTNVIDAKTLFKIGGARRRA